MSQIPSSSELENLFKSGVLQYIDEGRRRVCYRIPGSSLCVKFYKSPDERNKSISDEIRKFRFDEKRNTCCQEYRYYHELKEKLPPEVFSVFPEVCEQVLSPSHGWCLIESYYENCNRFTLAYRAADEENKKLLLNKFRAVINSFIEHSVRFYDTQNIMVQNGSTLRVVDFEPALRTFIPVDSIFPFLIKQKVRRRAVRFLFEHLGLTL